MHKKLKEIKEHAPGYRHKHLQERLDIARKRKNENTEKAIISILKREHDEKKYGRLRVAVGRQHGLPVAQIAVSYETGQDPIFLNKSQIDDAVEACFC